MRAEDTVEVGKRLRWLRQAHALTQETIARQLNVGRTRWVNWEVGTGRIPVDAAAQLVQIYGVTLDWIYLGREAGMPYDLMVKIRGISDGEAG
jgi:transcriptional regulator with XRE-family HTH domain